jgi:hypothetical protein
MDNVGIAPFTTMTSLQGIFATVCVFGCGGCNLPPAVDHQESKGVSHLRGPVSVLITISADPMRNAIDEALRSALSNYADVRFVNDGDDGVVDLKVDVLITSLPDDGAVLTVNTEAGGLLMIRARIVDATARLPKTPYATREVIARKDVQQACAEVATGISEAVFVRYLRHARKDLQDPT